MMPGYQELLVILLIVFLIFGGRKIPEIARGLGKGIREFKRAKDGAEDTKKQVSESVQDIVEGKESDKKAADAKA